MLDLALVVRARAAAEELMTDTCEVTRPGEGGRVWDDETNTYVDPAAVVVYVGACRLRATDATVVGESEVGGRELGVVRRSLRLPVDAQADGVTAGDPGDVTRHDAVNITESGAPGLVGAVFTVAGPFDDTHGSARRVPLEGVA